MKYIIDIDGTLLDGSQAINNSINFINTLNNEKIDYLVMTNSIKSKEVQFNRLLNAGFNITIDKIINPIVAINSYLGKGKIEYVKIIGSDSEIKQITANNTVTNYEMVILLDFEKTNIGYNILQEILNDIENGIEVITASVSLFYLNNENKKIDTGSFVRLLENISEYKIKNFGKPSEDYFKIAAEMLVNNNDICVIGDDWSTDIIGANKAGLKSILVKSGKYKNDDEYKCKPNKIINDLSEIKESSNN